MPIQASGAPLHAHRSRSGCSLYDVVVVVVESGTAFLTGRRRGSAGVHLPSEGRAHAVSQEKAPVAIAPLVEDSVLDEVEFAKRGVPSSILRGPNLTRVG